MEKEVYEEENKAIVPPKLGDVLEPPKDDSNTQTQNSIAIYEAPYTFCEGIRNHNPSHYDTPSLASNDTSEIINDKKCCLDMLYDTALDDGPILIDNPPCLHEDRDDKIVIHDDALIHESPILFLKSPIYTIDEKYAYVEKYLCGLQLPYEKYYCNHNAMIKNDIGNYFERGKHGNESLNKLYDPLYVPKISKLHDSNIHTIKFSSSNDIMCTPTNDIYWYTSTCYYLVLYKMPMHKKKVSDCYGGDDVNHHPVGNPKRKV
jgi:hypothetical protein